MAAENAFERQQVLYNRTYQDQSYANKVAQMDAAGLSPGLMYGGGGASGGGAGSTTGAFQVAESFQLGLCRLQAVVPPRAIGLRVVIAADRLFRPAFRPEKVAFGEREVLFQ